mmetsp:Transcript_52807/g.169065  ORF Transcript_52807/g.169065 Transcript_52807/m.169065 type:complete len:257 (-) Transcript_52807:107-877(-)
MLGPEVALRGVDEIACGIRHRKGPPGSRDDVLPHAEADDLRRPAAVQRGSLWWFAARRQLGRWIGRKGTDVATRGPEWSPPGCLRCVIDPHDAELSRLAAGGAGAPLPRLAGAVALGGASGSLGPAPQPRGERGGAERQALRGPRGERELQLVLGPQEPQGRGPPAFGLAGPRRSGRCGRPAQALRSAGEAQVPCRPFGERAEAARGSGRPAAPAGNGSELLLRERRPPPGLLRRPVEAGATDAGQGEAAAGRSQE